MLHSLPHRFGKIAIAVVMLLLCAFGTRAQFNLTNIAPTYTQNFNTLPTSTTAWTNNSTLANWYAASSNLTNIIAGTGSTNTGGPYSFANTTATSDRAFGSLGSGSTGTITYGVRLKNNGTTNITALAISYTGEQYRDVNTTPQAITFSYAINPTSITVGTYNNVTALDFTSPKNLNSGGAIDGNATGNKTAISSTITGLNIAPGAEIWLRISDIDNTGNDQGLAIDDMSVTATFVSANTAPVFVNSSPQTLSAVCIGSGAVALNTFLNVNDADASQTETWTVTTAPTKGSLSGFPATAASGSTSITPGGTLTYTPSTAGSDQFIIQVSDGTATASMTVNITNNTPATANAGATLTTCSGSPVTLAGSRGGSASSSTWSAPSGTFSDVTSLTSAYTPTISSGDVTLTLTTDDPTGPCLAATSTVTVTVNPLPAPTISGSATIPSGGSAILTFSGNTGDVISYTDGTTPASTTIGASGTGTVSVSPSTTTVYTLTSATSTFSCTASVSGQTATVTVSSAPTANISGSTDICNGSSAQLYFSGTAGGVVTYTDGTTPANVTLSGSSGIGTATVTVMPAGTTTYTLQSISSGGSFPLSGSATINVVAYPTVYNVTGSGSYCAGGAGIVPGLSNSQTGVSYQLFDASGAVGTPVPGNTGSPITFGSITVAGTYSVSASNATGCSIIMSGSATISVDPLPSAYSVTGTGTACAAVGVPVGLSNSETGINYQLYLGAATVGSSMPGNTGSPIAFGNQSVAGTYTVLATNSGTSCTLVMTGSAVVTITPLPSAGAIVGATTVIMGNTTQLSNAITGGAWTSSNTSIATISSTGLVFGVAPGTSTITYAVTNACGTATTSVTMTVTNVPATVTWNFTDDNSIADASTSSNVNHLNCSATIGNTFGSVADPVNSTSPSSGYTGSTGTGNIGNAANIGTLSSSSPYIEFEIEPNPGYSLSITGISFGSRSTGTGPQLVTVKSSVDGYTATLGSGAVSNNSTWALTSLTGFSGASLATSTSIFIRVYGSNGAGSPGSSTINWRLDDVTISYIATCITPAAQTVSGGGTICSGGAGIAIGLTNSAPGVNYQLYRGSSTVGSVVPGTGSSITFGPQTVAGTYSVSAATGTCTSNMTGNGIVTVNPAATADAGTPQTVCAGGTITLAGSIGGGAGSGAWSASSGTFSDVSDLSSTYTPSIASGNITLTLTTDDPSGPCAATTSTVQVTVAPVATANAGANEVVCAGGTVTLNGSTGGSASTGTWSAVSGSFSDVSSLTSTYTPSVASGDVVLTLTTDDPSGPCVAAVSTVTITVSPVATATAGIGQTVCAGGTITLNGSFGGSATTGTWSAPSGTFSDVSDVSSTYTPSVAGGDVVLTFTTDDPTGPCPAAAGTMTVTVNPVSTASAGPNDVVCAGGTITLAGAFGGSATAGTWSAPSGSFSDISSVTSTYTPSVANGDVVLTLTTDDPTGPCPAAVSTMTVTINPVATATAGPNQTVCAGSTVTLAGSTGGSATTGTWTALSGSFDNVNSMTAVYSPSITSGSVVLTLTTDDPSGPCPAAVSTMTVTINPVATASAGTNQTVCAGSTVTLAGSTGGSATTGTWTASSGAFDNVNSMTAVYSPSITSGSVVLTLTTDDPSGPCPAAVSTMTVTINPVATAAAGTNQTVCAGSTVTLAGSTGGSATTGTWTALSGSFDDINSMTAVYTPSITSGSVVLTLTTDDPTGPCPAAVSTMTVTVNPVATAAAGPNQTVCAGSTVTLAGSTGGSATTGTWTASSGSFSNVNSMTAVYSPSITSGSVVLTLTTNDPTGPCPAAVSTMTVTVNPAATASAGPNQTVCAGSTVTLAGSTGGSATTGTWTASSGSFSNVNSMTAVYSPSITSGSVVLTLTTDDPSGPCPAAVSTMTVTVNPVATAAAGPNQTVCAGSTVTLAGSTGGSATTGTWTASSGSFDNINSMTAVYSPSITSGSVVLTLTTDDPTGPCPAAVSTMTVTVNPVATAAAGPNQTVCAGSTVTLAGSTGGSATAGTWTASSGSFDDINSMTAVYSPSITSGSVVLTLTTDDPTGPCPTAISTMTVTINPVATAAAGPNQTVCAGGTVTLAGSTGGSATTGTWTASSGSFSNVNSMTAVYSPSITSGSVVLTLTTNDPTGPCPAAVSTMTVTVNPAATAIAGPNQTVCAGSTVTLAGSTGGGATTGTWSALSGSFDNVNSMTAVYSPSITSGSVVLTLTTNDPTGPCPAAVSTMTVTVNPAATAIAGPNQTVCAGSTVTLAGSTGGGATTGTWTASSGSFDNVNSMTAVYSPSITSGSVVLTLTTDDPSGPCPAAVSTMTVTVNSVATAAAGPSQTVCAGSTVTLAGSTGGSATTGTWTASSGSFDNINSMTAVYSPSITSGSVVLTLTTDDPSGPCPAAVSTMTVTINPVATATAGPNQTVCAGSTVTLAGGTGGSATTGTWTASSGSFSNVNSMTAVYSPSITSSSVVLTLTTDDPSGPCPAAVSTMTVTINPVATASAGPNQTVCAGSTVTLAGSTGGSATTGTWTASSGSFSNVNSMTAVYSPSITSGSVVLTLTTDDPTGPCPAAVSTMTVTINPVATASAGPNQTVCAGSTVTLAGSTGGSATTGTWTASSGSFDNINSMTAVYSPSITSGSVVLTLTTDDPSGPCPAAVSTMTVTINPVATASAGTNQTVCAGSTVTLAGSTGGSATTGTWTASSGAFDNVNSMTAVYSPSITSGSVVLTLTTDDPSGPCPAAVSTMTVTINPVATAAAGTNQTVCAGSTVTLAGSTGGSATTGTWTALSGSFDNINSMTAVYSPSITSGSVVLTLTTDDPSGPCPAAVSTMTVTVNPVATATAGTNQTVCAGSIVTLAGSTGGSATTGTWTASSGSFDNVNSMTAVYSPSITSGSVVLTLTTDDPTGPCPAAVSTMTVTVNPVATATAGSNQTVCAGSTVTLAGSTGGSAITGTWTASSGSFSNVNSMTAVYSPSITSGSVVLTLTTNDPSGPCPAAVSTMTITINPAAVVTAGANQSICAGGTVMLGGTISGGAASGTWSAPSGTFSDVASVTSAYTPAVSSGQVVLTLTTNDPSGPCLAAAATTTITVQPLTIVGAGNVCAGSSILLSDVVAGGTWSTAATTVATVSSTGAVTGIAPGSAEITYSTGVGCSATATVTVLANPSSITGVAAFCAGTTLQLSSATTGGTWTSSATGTAIVNNATGLVTGVSGGVANIIYHAGGCSTSASITVDPVSPIIGNVGVCAGSITLSNAVPGGTWSSSNTAVATIDANGTVTGVSSGQTVVSYVPPVGCVAIATVNVGTPSSITGNMTVCPGGITALSNAAPGGTWSTSTGTTATVDAAGNVYGVTAGAAYITYTIGTGCFTVANVTVITGPGPITGGVTICAGTAVNLYNSVSGGTWSTSSSIATITTGGVLTGAAGGSAVVTYTLPSGCMATRTLTINATSPITGGNTVCVSQEITLSNAIGGGAWSSGNGSLAHISSLGTVTGIGAGNVVIYYIWPNGCQKTTVVTVNPLMQSTGGSTVCQGQSVMLGNTTAGTGSWSSNNTAIGYVGSTGLLTGSGAGTVAIYYTTNLGCVATKTVNVSPAATLTGNMNVCLGQTTSLSANIAGGSWLSNSSVLATVSASGIVTGNAVGQALIYYVLPTGCQSTATVEVSDLRPITGVASLCAGTSVQLSNATAGGGTWSTDNTSVADVDMTTGVLLAGVPGSAMISFNAASGCVATKTITVNPAATVNAGANQAICAGSPAALNGSISGATSAQWSASSGTFANANALNTTYTPSITSGTVILTLTTMSGTGSCALATGTVAITVNPVPVIAGNTSICSGTTMLSPSVTGGTWSSSNSSVATINSAGLVTAGIVGNAIISYASPNGCIKSVTVNIGSPAAITGNTSVCTGTTVSLSNTVTGGTWRSSNVGVAGVGVNTGVVSGINAGTANITYALNSVCYTVATVTVSAMPAAVGGVTTICAGSSATLTNAVPGGIWSSSNSSVATVTASGIVTGVANGAAVITYATAPTCYKAKSITINPSAPITGNPAVCVGQATTLSNAVSGGSWISGSSSFATVSSTGVVTGAAAGNVTIYYLLPTGCQRTTTVAVNALSQITGLSSACSNKTIALSNATSGGGTWSSTNTLVATVNATGLVTGIGGGSTTISFTANNGCTTGKLITMNGAAPITGNFTVCVGQVTNVSTTSTGGNWSTSTGSLATVSSTGVVGGVAAGTPRVSYIQTNGCQSVATVTVNALSTITGGTQGMCQSATMALSNATIGGGVWTSSNTTIATVSATGLVRGVSAGPVSIMFTTPLACVATRTVSVNACREADTSSITSVAVSTLADDIRLFPNPNKGIFTLKGSLAFTTDEEVSIEVVNMTGQVIYRNSVQVRNGDLEKQVGLPANLANGMYLLNIRTTNGSKLFHFVLEQ